MPEPRDVAISMPNPNSPSGMDPNTVLRMILSKVWKRWRWQLEPWFRATLGGIDTNGLAIVTRTGENSPDDAHYTIIGHTPQIGSDVFGVRINGKTPVIVGAQRQFRRGKATANFSAANAAETSVTFSPSFKAGSVPIVHTTPEVGSFFSIGTTIYNVTVDGFAIHVWTRDATSSLTVAVPIHWTAEA